MGSLCTAKATASSECLWAGSSRKQPLLCSSATSTSSSAAKAPQVPGQCCSGDQDKGSRDPCELQGCWQPLQGDVGLPV